MNVNDLERLEDVTPLLLEELRAVNGRGSTMMAQSDMTEVIQKDGDVWGITPR